MPADGKWAYDVFFGPAWQKSGQPRYSKQRRVEQTAKSGPQNKVGSDMSWAPNEGQVSACNFGIVAADHRSRANTCFPGFFMHPTYLRQTLRPGNRVLWQGRTPDESSAEMIAELAPFSAP